MGILTRIETIYIKMEHYEDQQYLKPPSPTQQLNNLYHQQRLAQPRNTISQHLT